MRDRKPKEALGKIISNMATYATLHFQTEEIYMNQFNYPDYEKHKNEHEQFVAKVYDFQAKFKQGTLMLSLDVMDFLKSWLKDHIVGSDKKYSACFNQNGLS